MLNNIQPAKQIIKNSEAILITAGAGMGVDSGLPDFRGNEGFWKAYPPIKKLRLSFSQMANPSWFDVNPSLAWAFYGHRLDLYRNTIPHDGFQILLNLAKTKTENYFIFTSNVDGQFTKASFDTDKMLEVHGSIHHLQCSKNCTGDIWKNDEIVNVDMESFQALNIPVCPKCTEVARPNILMFGDWNWNSKRTNKQQNRYKTWLDNNKDKNIAIIELGAGNAIPTVRLQGERLAKQYKNIQLIRINPRDYNLDSSLGVSLNFGALEGLRAI